MNTRYYHLGLFVVAVVLFGGTFVAARAGLAYFPPLLFVALRFDLAAALLVPYVMLRHDDWRPRTRRDVAGVFVTGVPALGLSNALLFVGQQFVTSAVASIIFSLAPILTPVLAFALLPGGRLSAREIAGLLLGLLGVGIIVNPDPANLLQGSGVGQAILLCGAISVALGSVLISWVDADLPSTVQTAWGLPIGAATLHLVSATLGESFATIEWTGEALLTLGYVGIFAGAIAYTAYFALLAETGPVQTNLINYGIPVVTALLGWALLDETISVTTVAGFLVIFLGFLSLKYPVVREEIRAVVW